MDDHADRLSLFCDRCKEEGFSQDSMAWCVDCRKHFCSKCLLENKIKRKEHSFLSTMKYREFLINSYFGRFENCYVHSDVESNYYCLKHQTTACERCKRLVHLSCDEVIRTDEVAMNIRLGVDFPDLAERLKDSILSFESLINEHFENRKKLDIMKDKVVNDLLKIREDIDIQLERIHSEVLKQLEKSYDQLQGMLDNIVSYMEEIKEEVNQLKIDTEIVANNLPDIELFFFVKAAEKHQIVTEKAIHELRKTKIDIKFRHDIEFGLRDLKQIHKQLTKLHVMGDNISNVKLEERKAEKEKHMLKTSSNEELSLPLGLGRDTPSTVTQYSPRDNASTGRYTFRSASRVTSSAMNDVTASRNDNTSVSQMSFRSTSRASVPTYRSTGDYGRLSGVSLKNQRSPREYEHYLDKVRSGRLGQIKESEKYTEEEDSGIKTNIRNESFSLQTKFRLPKRNKAAFVTDLACLSRGRFVAADYNNKCLMLYDLHGTLSKEAILNEHPQCIAVMSGSEIAVTTTGSKSIMIVDTTSLQTIRHVTAPFECEGITFTENRLVVNCIHEGIFILSKTGKVLSKFPKLTGAMYLCMSMDHRLVCSMGVSGVLLEMSFDGREHFRLKHETLKRPSGVTWDQFGNIYVATWSNNSIIQLSDNGKSHKVVLESADKVASPWGIDYDKAFDVLVVSSDNGESIAIYKRNAHR